MVARRQKGLEILPPVGIFNEDGIRFYHLRRIQLRPEHLQRLDDCGVKLSKGPFSKEESAKIKENWKKYAEANGIAYDRAYEFTGGYIRRMDHDDRKQLQMLHDQTNFVPAMCEGLDSRTGLQVITRMALIYHPYARSSTERSERKWSDEMEKQFEELLSAGLTSKQISICLKVSQTTVNYRIRMKRLKEEQAEFVSKELNDSARQTLYDFVTKWLSPRRCPLELQDMLPERLSWNAADFAMVEDQKKAMSFLPWQTIAQKMHCSLLEIQGHWLHEVEKLREACESCGGNSEEATKMCCPGVPMITAGEFRRALSLILEQNPESARFIDVSKLQQRIEEENLIGYCTNGLIEAEFLKNELMLEVSRWKRSIIMDKRMTFCDQISTLKEYLKHVKAGRKCFFHVEVLNEILARKLRKKRRQETTQAGIISNATADTSSASLAAPCSDEDCSRMDITASDDREMISSHCIEAARSDEPSSNSRVEYGVEALKNLIESRIPLFDESKGQKFSRKLSKIMSREEKLEALQKLVEKMISGLEGEQERKTNKKYRKIVRRMERIREPEETDECFSKGTEAQCSIPFGQKSTAANFRTDSLHCDSDAYAGGNSSAYGSGSRNETEEYQNKDLKEVRRKHKKRSGLPRSSLPEGTTGGDCGFNANSAQKPKKKARRDERSSGGAFDSFLGMLDIL